MKTSQGIEIAFTVANREGKNHVVKRYYIMSQIMSAKQLADAVRGHWPIQNQRLWRLDVSFSEDKSRVLKGNGTANFSILRQIALAPLKRVKPSKVGIKNKRVTAALLESRRLKALFSQRLNTRLPWHETQGKYDSPRQERLLLVTPQSFGPWRDVEENVIRRRDPPTNWRVHSPPLKNPPRPARDAGKCLSCCAANRPTAFS